LYFWVHFNMMKGFKFLTMKFLHISNVNKYLNQSKEKGKENDPFFRYIEYRNLIREQIFSYGMFSYLKSLKYMSRLNFKRKIKLNNLISREIFLLFIC
jgi:hypothetical protein